jgi:pimeloyl-ACP methyl ester carboxylesterase
MDFFKKIIFAHQKLGMNYQISGQGKALVLLHGFLEDSRIWDPFLAQLEKKHQVVLIDLFGHGKSEKRGHEHTMEAQAKAIQKILIEENIGEASFIGHSLGGYVSLAFTEIFPEKTKSLILLNSTSEADSEERKNNRDRAISFLDSNKEVYVNMAIKNLFAPQTLERCKTDISVLVKRAQKLSAEAIIATVKGMKNRKDRTEVLRDFSGEKVIIAGKNDPIIPFEDIQKVSKETHSILKTLPNGHMGYLENEVEVKQIFEGLFL